MARKAAAQHQRKLEERNKDHAAALSALVTRTSACEKRTEQAEAEVAQRRNTQRDVQEALGDSETTRREAAVVSESLRRGAQEVRQREEGPRNGCRRQSRAPRRGGHRERPRVQRCSG